MLILLGMLGRFSREMLVVSASVNLKNFAEDLNVVLETKLMIAFNLCLSVAQRWQSLF